MGFAVGETELELLASLIVQKLSEEFSVKHLSRNLVRTIKVESLGDEIKIYIPAQTYNMLLFQLEGVVVHDRRGSYASSLDENGGEYYTKGGKKVKSTYHKGYIDKIINQAIAEWSSMVGRERVKREG